MSRPEHVSEPLSRVLVSLLKRNDPEKARKFVREMREQISKTGNPGMGKE